MVVEILFFGPPVSKLNSTLASTPELGKTKSTEFPLENRFDDVPEFKSFFKLLAKSSIT
jgi:hypothetical protein